MNIRFTTANKLLGKALFVVFLLVLLSACREREGMLNDLPSTQQNFSSANEVVVNVKSTSVFHLAFENSLVAKNDATPHLAGSLNFTAGIDGHGLCFGRFDTLQYLAEGNIDHRHGSLSVWIKPNWKPGALLYKILYYGRNPKHFEMHVDENELVAFGLNSSSMENEDIRVAFGDAFDWVPGAWRHIAYTWSSEEIGLYIDGVLMEKIPVEYEIPAVSDSIFHIGSVDGYEGFDGVLDELTIFNYPLSEQEVNELYLHHAGSILEAYVEDCQQASKTDSTWTVYF